MCISTVTCNQIIYSGTDIINYTVEYFTENLKINQVILIGKLPYQLSSFQMLFTQKIINIFPTLAIDLTKQYNTSYKQYFVQGKNSFFKTSGKSVLRLIITNYEKECNTTQRLVEYITFINNFFSNSDRTNHLIILISKNKIAEILEFFQYIWSYKLIDVTVIELIENADQLQLSYSNSTSKVVIHQYNPYNNTYQFQNFPVKFKLFPDKHINMYGFRFRTIFKNYLSILNSESKDLSRPIESWLVLMVKALSKKMNFSFAIKITNDSNPLSHDEYIDFSLITYKVIYGRFTKRVGYIALYNIDDTNTMIIRQYPSYGMELANDFFIFTAVFIIILSIAVFSVWFLKFDSNTWTTFNIIRILSGNPASNKIQRFSERIMFLCLVYIYGRLSTYVLDISMKVEFSREKIIGFKTIEDAERTGIVPCLIGLREYHKSLSTSLKDELVIKKLVKRAQSNCDSNNCFSELYANMKNYNACEMDGYKGKVVAKLFSTNVFGWIISLIDDPIIPYVKAMLVLKPAPYYYQFCKHFQRLYQSGLVKYWMQKQDRDYEQKLRLEYKDYFEKKKAYENNIRQQISDNDFYVDSELYINYLLLYLIACSISAFVFLCEFILDHLYPKVKKHVIASKIDLQITSKLSSK